MNALKGALREGGGDDGMFFRFYICGVFVNFPRNGDEIKMLALEGPTYKKKEKVKKLLQCSSCSLNRRFIAD